MSTPATKSAKELWQDYLFLTRELAKCLLRDDFPLFEELLGQRGRLQGMIEECQQQNGEATGFSSEQDRRELLAQVKTADEELHKVFRVYQNNRKHHSDAAMAYEGLDNPLVGMRMDKQR